MIKIQLSDYSLYVYSSFVNRMFYAQNGKENEREMIKTRGYHRPINEVVLYNEIY